MVLLKTDNNNKLITKDLVSKVVEIHQSISDYGWEQYKEIDLEDQTTYYDYPIYIVYNNTHNEYYLMYGFTYHQEPEELVVNTWLNKSEVFRSIDRKIRIMIAKLNKKVLLFQYPNNKKSNNTKEEK